MKIARIETFLVPPRWLFVRVETDTGVVGWGEPVLEGRAATVRAAVHELSSLLIGHDATRIEDAWQMLTKAGFYRFGPILSSAVAGLDQALWDINGKRLGVPVHELLGGAVRDRARVYAWIAGDRPDEVAEQAAERVSQGFTCMKMNGSAELEAFAAPSEVKANVERAYAVREAIGDLDFALDFHGRYSPAMAHRTLPLLEDAEPMFVEEPVLPELAVEHLPRLVARTSIPLATGERAFSRHDFDPLLRTGMAIAQPDVSHAGGISEMRRIAAQAEVHGVGLAPHCPLGPLALASCLQVDFASPNFVIQEQSRGIHYNTGWDVLDYVLDAGVFDVVDGAISRLTAPGLGVDIDEAAVRDADRRGHDWHAPVWRHRDGGLAEW